MNISLESIQTIINGLKEYIGDRLNIISKELLKIKKDIRKNKSTASQAQSTATQAQSTATQAQSTASQAQSTATQAQSTATQAQSTATQAQSTAIQAQSTASQAQSHVQNISDIVNELVATDSIYAGKAIELNNNKVYRLKFMEYDEKLNNHNVYICGPNLFNVYGDVNIDASTGEERPGYNVVSNGILTANLYSDNYEPNGQKFTFLKGKKISFYATCIEGNGYIGIYENGVESKFVTGKNKLVIREYTVQSDNTVFVLHTVGSIGGAKFTEIQLEVSRYGGTSIYQDYKAFCIPINIFKKQNFYITTERGTVIYNDQDAYMKVSIYNDKNNSLINELNLLSARNLFQEVNILKPPRISSEDFYHTFGNCNMLACCISNEVYTPKSIRGIFSNCHNLQMIEGCLDLKNISRNFDIPATGRAFFDCRNLSYIESITNIKSSLDFSDCPLNTRTVDMLLSNLLETDVRQTLSFRSDIVDRLTDEQLAKVPAGWNIQ